jgi:hypothetical protein
VVCVCDARGSSRYPDGVEDTEREILFVARDQFGNRLGISPRELSKFSVTLARVSDKADKGAPAANDDSADAAAADVPSVRIVDDGAGVLRATYPILELGTHAITVSLGSDLLLSRKVVFGRALDRPRNAPHWREELNVIFLSEFSVDQQRAEMAQAALEVADEDRAAPPLAPGPRHLAHQP